MADCEGRQYHLSWHVLLRKSLLVEQTMKDEFPQSKVRKAIFQETAEGEHLLLRVERLFPQVR